MYAGGVPAAFGVTKSPGGGGVRRRQTSLVTATEMICDNKLSSGKCKFSSEKLPRLLERESDVMKKSRD